MKRDDLRKCRIVGDKQNIIYYFHLFIMGKFNIIEAVVEDTKGNIRLFSAVSIKFIIPPLDREYSVGDIINFKVGETKVVGSFCEWVDQKNGIFVKIIEGDFGNIQVDSKVRINTSNIID